MTTKGVLASAFTWVALWACVAASAQDSGQEAPEALRASVEGAVARVKPALVRIHVVYTRYSEGRELKNESVGSGVVITKEGHVITNHHVAGHATRLMCTFPDKDEIEAELVGKDPLTDIAVLQLKPREPREFPVAQFGDSDALYVGEYVLAMGCPMALSQSVTLGIVSNTQMVMPEWSGMADWFKLDGENVGALVRWIAHDAEIYGGNSGGPLVNLKGEVVGINEIRLGLGGAIPGNLAQTVARDLIANKTVTRSWLGLDVQPLLERDREQKGILVCGTIDGSPAQEAGFQSGDILIQVGDTPVGARYPEELPAFNRLVAGLPVGGAVEMTVLRDGQEKKLQLTTIEREEARPKEHELKQWGITVRNLSIMDVKELKRDSPNGVLVTSVRPGGPAGEAKPSISAGDILVMLNGALLVNVDDLRSRTEEITREQTDPVPALTGFERKTAQYVTVVRVGIRELPAPALQVRKAWLPVETQVVTRDIAEALGRTDLTGFRITHVYRASAAEKAGLQVGDIVLAVDDEKLTASAPEHQEELAALIRQYKIGSPVVLKVLRDGSEQAVPIELVTAPEMEREMKKYQDESFEFTVREVSFFDRAREKWAEDQRGVIVDEVKTGGWAALGNLNGDDLVLNVDDTEITDVPKFEEQMRAIADAKPGSVVVRVLRGIHMAYLELKPKWDEGQD